MGWTAVYLPATDGDDPTECGFESEEEAWEYVGSHICSMCKEDIEGDDEYVETASDTMCGAEWLVITDEDYYESESFPDLMKAAGYKRVYPEGKENEDKSENC